MLLATGDPEGAISYWVLKLYSQLWDQVYYGVKVKVQVYYGVKVRVPVRAVLLATGDPKRVIGLLGSGAIFPISAMGSRIRCGSGPLSLQRSCLQGLWGWGNFSNFYTLVNSFAH